MPSWPAVFSPQQDKPPFAIRAQLWRRPVVIVTPRVRGFGLERMDICRGTTCTTTGVVDGVVVLLPNWPEPLSPQQRAPPSATIAQVCPNPPAIATAFALNKDGSKRFTTALGAGCGDTVVPIPSWPRRLPPQHHHAMPKAWSAQVCEFPPAMATTLSRLTSVGLRWLTSG